MLQFTWSCSDAVFITLKTSYTRGPSDCGKRNEVSIWSDEIQVLCLSLVNRICSSTCELIKMAETKSLNYNWTSQAQISRQLACNYLTPWWWVSWRWRWNVWSNREAHTIPKASVKMLTSWSTQSLSHKGRVWSYPGNHLLWCWKSLFTPSWNIWSSGRGGWLVHGELLSQSSWLVRVAPFISEERIQLTRSGT